jgi:DNA polymerase III delta prime subunit
MFGLIRKNTPGASVSAASAQKPFIQRYKPTDLASFFASSKFKSVLRTLLQMDDLNIIFIGNTCSGKTILLNTLIREYYGLVNQEPLPEHNILFINNLKEQGVSYFRNELKTFCQSHSLIRGKKKMVIIDDIDTMNEQSQQVFRNFMDKYRHNVHFLSVCTNIQKVIESIQSRLHIIRIEPTTKSQIEELYDRIVADCKMEIAADARVHLLSFCQNSIRALINNMEKIWILGKPIDLETCIKICGIDTTQYEKYLRALRSQDVGAAIKIMYDIHDYGYSVIDIMETLFSYMKSTDILTEEEKYKIIQAFCKYITVFYTVHENIIELAYFTVHIAEIITPCDASPK